MKKKMLGLIAATLLLSGCGKVPTLSNGDEAVVSFENGEMISVNELYEKIKDTYALSTIITMIDTYVLETSFPDYKDTAKETAESYINALRENYETEDDLLNDIKTYTGMSSVEAYQEYLYISYMESHAAEEYAKSLVTDKQIEKYYKDEFKGDVEVSHILITPDVTDDMKDDEKKAKEEEAKEKANSLLKELKEVDNDKLAEKFASLAKENSEDSATKEKGGALGKLNKTTLSSNYDELIDAAYKTKDGALYGKVVTTELGYHVIYKTKTHDKLSLEDAEDTIRKVLAEELFAKEKTISYDALNHYRDELGMKIEDSEIQTQYAYYMNNLLNSINETEEQK